MSDPDSIVSTGAVAVLDALGFKGIWKSWRPEDILRKLEDTVNRTDGFEAEQLLHGEVHRLKQVRRLRFLSDTIVIASSITANPEAEASPSMLAGYDRDALFDVCNAVAGLQRWMLRSALGPPLAYRGAIAFGEFLIRGSFLIGPAVDEAAEAEKLAEGALVWFCPSALKRLTNSLGFDLPGAARPGRDFPVKLPWAVPLKGGHRFETAVVRPDGSNDELLGNLNAAFRLDAENTRVDVIVKYQNTREFLLGSTDAAPQRRT